MGPKPPPQAMRLWIQTLNLELGENALSLCRNVGKGFFLLKGEDRDALNAALMKSPFRSKWGTCMMQRWVPGFNPDNPSNLAFPTWVSLRNLPHEHQDQAISIAGTLGEVIGMETANDTAKDPRFCVNLEISKGWATSIELVTEGGILPPQTVMIDYDKLPIRCRVCLSWKHKASDCKEVQKRPLKGRERPAYNHTTHQQEKGKNIAVDQDGFQQVKNKKNIRRNIFENDRERGQNSRWRGNGGYQAHTFGAAAPTAAQTNTEKGWGSGSRSITEHQKPPDGTLQGEGEGRDAGRFTATAGSSSPRAQQTEEPGRTGNKDNGPCIAEEGIEAALKEDGVPSKGRTAQRQGSTEGTEREEGRQVTTAPEENETTEEARKALNSAGKWKEGDAKNAAPEEVAGTENNETHVDDESSEKRQQQLELLTREGRTTGTSG